MEWLLKKSLSRRKVLALLPVFAFVLARQGAAQNFVVSDYRDLTNALQSFTNITNFSATATLSTPTIIFWTNGNTITISNNITINAGSNFVLLQGDGAERFFNVTSNATLTLNNLELTNGGSTNGGAIYNKGTLIISNCVLTGNMASNISGVNGTNHGFNVNATDGGNGAPAAGGAIYSTGPLFISYSILTNNTVQAGNGGNGGTAINTLEGSANGGSAGNGGNALGGAIYSTGSNNVFYLTEFFSNECLAGDGGSGGSFATNVQPFGGSGGATGLGGSCAGGAVFVGGSLSMSNCLFYDNVAQAGFTGAAEVDSDGGGADGSPGGSAFGGALFVTNGVTNVGIQNTIVFSNICHGGYGGSTALNAAIGGNGGQALGGGVWSGANLMKLSFCTVATNYVIGGVGGTNTAGGINGTNGVATGWNIFRSVGVVDLSDSILSGTPLNAVGVTDDGYNVISDSSVPRSPIIPTTKDTTDPLLDFKLSVPPSGGTNIGGPFGSPLLTLAILNGSPAAGFVPGVPGVTFPLVDEALQDRSTPTSAGAFELNYILSASIVTNAATNIPNMSAPPTNLTGSGYSVAFTNTVNPSYTNSLTLGYQWQLDGTNIYDNANYSGTASNILTIKDVTAGDEGAYTVLISPTLLEGVTTSAPPVYLILTNPPVIKAQPASQLNRPVGAIVSFILNVGPYPQAFNYQWMQDGTNLPASANYFGTNSNVLTINPALTNDAGTYAVTVFNNYGSKTSANARLTIVPDHTRPTMTITNPAVNNIRTNAPVFGGTASDNAQVTNVMYWFTNINGGLDPVTNVISGNAILTTNGSTNLNKTPNVKLWSITNLPLPGTNILAVQSVDYSSNVSAVLTRRFFYIVTNELSLTTNAGAAFGGTLTGHAFIHGDPAPSNGASLNIGEGYSIVAVPNSSSLLGTWTNTAGTTVIITNGNTLKFIMESNTVIQALFVSNIFQETGNYGAFNGLFYVTNDIEFETAGMLDNLVLGKKGTFSGKLLLAGGRYTLSGAFDAFGSITDLVKLPAVTGQTLTVVMNMNTNGAGIITGTVSNSVWPTNADLLAGLAAATTGTTNYTLLMPPPTNPPANPIPTGDGYALITDTGGKVTLSGGLADGTTFSQTVPASQSNAVPVYASLYGRTGFLLGWLNLTNLYNTNGTNGLSWIKETPTHPTLLFPGGFTNLLQTEGLPWTDPGVITLSSSTNLVISNATLFLNYTVAVSDNDKLVNATDIPTNSLTGRINLKTGQLQVTFGNGNGRATTRGNGAMLQNTTNTAGGYFATKTNSGSITLQP
jgi:hypothetical protein